MSDGFNAFDQKIEAIAEDELSEERLLEMLDRVRMRKELESIDGQVRKQLRRIIEGLLFASSGPLSFRKIREVCDTLYPVRPKILLSMLTELRDEYRDQERAFQLEEIGKGFVLRTHESIGTYVEQLYRNKRTERLSAAATEVLAIIAYRQPVTRSQIDAIRGVDSSGTLQALVERELVEVVGRLEAPGRPSLYSVTENFLTYFGYKDLSELPRLGTDEELAEETKPKKAEEEAAKGLVAEQDAPTVDTSTEQDASEPAEKEPQTPATTNKDSVDQNPVDQDPVDQSTVTPEPMTVEPQTQAPNAAERAAIPPTLTTKAVHEEAPPVETPHQEPQAQLEAASKSPALWSQFSLGDD